MKKCSEEEPSGRDRVYAAGRPGFGLLAPALWGLDQWWSLTCRCFSNLTLRVITFHFTLKISAEKQIQLKSLELDLWEDDIVSAKVYHDTVASIDNIDI